MAEATPSPRGADYDQFVDWEARLKREGPFFKRLFEEAGVSRVIDVGAGSGRHAIMFATWGLEVVAVDPDPGMLDQARKNVETFADEIAAGGGSVTVLEGGFRGLSALGLGLFDALTCTGNALPHAGGRDGLTETFADFASVVAPGGVLVLHMLNHARLLDGKVRAIPPKVRETPEGTKVYLRIIDYPPGGEFIDFDFVTLTRDPEGAWSLSSRRSPHTAITPRLLHSELPCCGFAEIELLGDHDGRQLEPTKDESVIVVARRR